jgi:RND superfamily putative drug exporter
MPSIATLLGRWFWWPQRVRTHAARPPVAYAAGGAHRSATEAATTQPLGMGRASSQEQQ